MEYRVHADVCVRESKTHGLGVFARSPVKVDSVIETCAVLENMYRHTPGQPCAFRRYLCVLPVEEESPEESPLKP